MTRLRRALGPYGWKALTTMWRSSLRLLLIVLVAAVAGLFTIKTIREARDHASEQKRETFLIDESLVIASPDLGPAAQAMQDAMTTLQKRPKNEHSFSTREALVAAVLPIVMRSPDYPSVTKIIAEHKKTLETRASAVFDAKTQERQLEAMRRRELAVDAMRLELATLPDLQRDFIASAVKHLDTALERRASEQQAAKQQEKKASSVAGMADAKNPLHVVYEAVYYLAFVVVALAISYCAALVLKLLPYPGAAEKWSSKLEETFSAERRAEPKSSSSPIASILLTTTVLGVGLLAASDPLHDSPSPFSNANLGSLLPDYHPESSQHVQVQLPPAPTLSPTFEFSPAFSPVNPITVPPAVVHVDKPDLSAISAEMQRTNEMLETMQDLLEQETRKTDELQRVITDAKREWGVLGGKLENAGAQLRNSIVAANYNDEQRHLLATRQQAVAGAHSAWRSLLILGRYQVTPTTIVAFETEPCDQMALHLKLRESLEAVQTEGLEWYQSPFESTLINRMITPEESSKRGKEFKAARTEVWRHLPVLLETSRRAERGMRKTK
jgi:hypothetical protein